MFMRSVAPILRRELTVLAMLACLKTRPAAALLTTPTVHLFSAFSVAPNPDSIAADFTEMTFSGYAAQALTLGAVIPNLPTGNGMGIHGEVDFTADSGIVLPGETALGYYVDEGAGVTLYMAELFATPFPFVVPFDQLSLDVIFPALFQVATGA